MRVFLFSALIVLGLALTHAVGAQESQAQHPLALTAESLARATVDQRGGGSLQLSIVHAKVNRGDYNIHGDSWDSPERALQAMEKAPFFVYLLTPYVRAAVTSAEARRRYDPPLNLNADTLNGDGIIVSITTPDNFIKAESIESVVLSLADNTIIRPFKTALERRTVSNALGASKTVTVGAFHFRFTDFDKLPLTLICVGAATTERYTVGDLDLVR